MKSGKKTKSCIWLCLLVLAAGQVPAVFCGDGSAAYEQAQQLRSEGRLADAEQAFLQALQEEPNNADYHFELSNLYAAVYDQGQGSMTQARAQMLLERSERELVQTLMFRPDHLPARFNLGVVYKRLGKYELAREEFRRTLARSPQLAAAWYQIGSTYEEQGFWDEAEDAYFKAREAGSDPAEIQEALENLRQRRLNPPQSETALGGLGTMGGGSPLFGNQAYNAAGRTDLFGRPLSDPYGNDYTGAQPAAGGSMQNALPSLAAMMIQQFLSRNSQSSRDSR